jgi:hypothetical protein
MASIALLLVSVTEIFAAAMTEEPAALQSVAVRAALTAGACLAGFAVDSSPRVFSRVSTIASLLLAAVLLFSLAAFASQVAEQPQVLERVLPNVALQVLTLFIAARTAMAARR